MTTVVSKLLFLFTLKVIPVVFLVPTTVREDKETTTTILTLCKGYLKVILRFSSELPSHSSSRNFEKDPLVNSRLSKQNRRLKKKEGLNDDLENTQIEV